MRPSLRNTQRWLWLCAVGSTACGCTSEPTSKFERAEFGVIFGGQCQERLEIPFELDASKQALGFVIQLKQAFDTDVPVHWELAKPGAPVNGVPNPLGRRTELFDGVLQAFRSDFQMPINLNPGDPLGTWNIRVVVGRHVAIDRLFFVFDRERRRRNTYDAGLR
jgi:hypothetical protein